MFSVQSFSVVLKPLFKLCILTAYCILKGEWVKIAQKDKFARGDKIAQRQFCTS